MAEYWRGLWVTATSYASDNYVRNGGVAYKCTSSHTSSASTEPGVGGSWSSYWSDSFWGGDTFQGEITVGITYDSGVPAESAADRGYIDVDGTEQYYRCILDHTADANNIPEETNWETYWELLMETQSPVQDPAWKDEWSSSSVDYIIGDICYYDDGGGDGLYVCHEDHTSSEEESPDAGGGYWTELTNFIYEGTWASEESYTDNDVVENDSEGYICILEHTSDSSNEPGTGVYWETYWVNILDIVDLTPSYGSPWASDEFYNIDDTVTRGGLTWVCIATHYSSSTNEPESGNSWGDYWDYSSGSRAVSIAGDEWSNLPYYIATEFVVYNDITYEAKYDHKANGAINESLWEPGVGSSWSSMWEVQHHSWRGLWNSPDSYIDEDWVIDDDDNIYDCILGHISDATNEPGTGTYWETYWNLRSDLNYRGTSFDGYETFSVYDIAVDDTDPNDLIAYVCLEAYTYLGPDYLPPDGSYWETYWTPFLHWVDYVSGNWADVTEYYLGDTVSNEYMVWICIAYHTSDSTSEPYNGAYWATYWEFVSGSPAASHEADAWETLSLYGEDDVVSNDYLFYICILAHQASSTTEPGTGTYWETYWELSYPFKVYGTYDSTDYEMPILATENLYWRNVQGTPCTSITPLNHTESGYRNLIPGRYKITFDADSVSSYNGALSSCDTYYVPHSTGWDTCVADAQTNNPILALVDCLDAGDFLNPNINSTGIEVDVSSGNANTNIIPGLNIVLTETPNSNHIFEVIVGGIWVSAESRYVKFLPFGDVLCGTSSDSVRLKLENPFWFDMEDVEVYFLNKITVQQDEESVPFYSIYQSDEYNPTALEDTTALNITFTDYVSGSPSTVTLLIDGNEHDIIDVDAQTTNHKGRFLKCDSSTLYMFANQTAYQGLTFKLSSSLDASDTATILISPGSGIWETKNSGDSDYTAVNRRLAVGTISGESSVSIDVRATPGMKMGNDMNLVEGLMRISGDSYERHIPFSATIIDGELNFVFDVNVFSGDVVTALTSFGVGMS